MNKKDNGQDLDEILGLDPIEKPKTFKYPRLAGIVLVILGCLFITAVCYSCTKNLHLI